MRGKHQPQEGTRMETETTMTTAKLLLNYRNELTGGGIDPECADLMTRDAAGIIINAEGLGVRNA